MSSAQLVLPLAEGYNVSFRNLNSDREKIQLNCLRVVGLETITVPAGSFAAYKVEIASERNYLVDR